MSLTLVIGNKNYSSWSLRPWLAMKHAQIPFDEVRIPLQQADTTSEIRRYSPSARVPCLIDGTLTVWDSLAICEYVNEQHARGALWPREVAARARARAVVAEMHSGFGALRTHMAMDIRSHHSQLGAVARARPDVAQNIARIQEIWNECLAASSGPFLFGAFSIADAFFAPVVTRFRTYDVPLSARLSGYSDAVLALPPMREWTAAATAETEVIPV